MLNTNYGASLGTVNLKTGSSKYFNIYETWGEDTTYEIYEIKKERGIQYKIFATSGKSPIRKIGDVVHDVSLQGRKRFFNGKMVDYAVGSDLKNLAEKYGNRLGGYTYK
jgi:hypothetical protein